MQLLKPNLLATRTPCSSSMRPERSGISQKARLVARLHPQHSRESGTGYSRRQPERQRLAKEAFALAVWLSGAFAASMQFRRWATGQLEQLRPKGSPWTTNASSRRWRPLRGNRPFVSNIFRPSERVFLSKVLDIYPTSVDCDPRATQRRRSLPVERPELADQPTMRRLRATGKDVPTYPSLPRNFWAAVPYKGHAPAVGRSAVWNPAASPESNLYFGGGCLAGSGNRSEYRHLSID